MAWFNPLVWWAARRGALDRERACDDRVIGCGFQGLDYGQCLVEIAAAVSGRIMPVTAAVSMAEPPMKLRLQSILSSAADRRRESKSYRGFVMAVFVGLAVLLGIVRPIATAPAANPTVLAQPQDVEEQADMDQDSAKTPDTKTAENIPPDDEMIQLTQPVAGTITDKEGTPIAGAEVLIKLRNFQGETQHTRQTTTIREWHTTTDENGRYAVDVSDLGKQPSRFCIGVQNAYKHGFAPERSEFFPSLGSVAVFRFIELEPVKLTAGRRITGQILDSTGKPIGGVVKSWARSESGNTWLSSGSTIGDDGKLDIDVPVDSDAELAINAADHSPIFITVPSGQSDVGTVTLSLGTIVSGQVLDLHGQPAKGVVVELKSESRRLKGLLPTWSRVAVTDDNGAFTLLPASGDCIIRVHESVMMFDRVGGYESVSGNLPPLVVPLELKLKSERSHEEIVLHESESHRITGTARWDDGQPVKDLEVTGSIKVEASSEYLAAILTDENGHYEMRLPKDLRASVSASGAYRDDDKTVWCMAQGNPPAPFVGNSQIVSVKTLTADVGDVDWELRPERAMERITQEMATAVQQRPTIAVWLFDESQSLESRRKLIANRFEYIYGQLGLNNNANAKNTLTTGIVGYGENVHVLVGEPTSDLAELTRAVRTIKNDESGKENVFAAVAQALDIYAPLKGKMDANLMFVIVTDERGDDVQKLEEIIKRCKDEGVRVYCLGNASVFGRDKGFVRFKWEHEGQQYEEEIPLDQGPETVIPENLQLPFWTKQRLDLNNMSSGFGPYALSRLCADTGGVFLIAEETTGEKWDSHNMQKYAPDYRPIAEYTQQLQANLAKQAVVEAAQMALTEQIRIPQQVFSGNRSRE